MAVLTREIELQGYETYVQISSDSAQDFSGTIDSVRQSHVLRTDDAAQPAVGPGTNGRPVSAQGVVERQGVGFYWARGVGLVSVDDL